MAVSENTGGTQTATVGTEHSLATIATAGTYVYVVDTVNMAAGDVLELRIKLMARSGGTRRLVYFHAYPGAQTTEDKGEIKLSVPVPSPHSIEFTLKQTKGTGRDYVWAVYEL